MSARAAELVAGTRERWPLAGDQLYVDLDISEANLPARHAARGRHGGRRDLARAAHRLQEVRRALRRDAMLFVNSPEGRALRLRGVNARVVEPGVVRPGDEIRKLA